MAEFLRRLKQRKLVQWAVAYVAFAFALIQVLDVVADSYHWPDHAMHIVFGLLVLGFIVTLVLAWYHGERGAQRVSGPELLLIALALVIGGGLLWHFGRSPQWVPKIAAHAMRPALVVANATVWTAFNPPADTLVVLPFQNLSGDPKQQYFSDGITQELTGALGQNPALRVIAWETASTLRDPKLTAHEIGEKLDVANILHGSIEREGNQVRISVELVNAVTGYERWSQHYDDSFANIFKVQDKVSQAIASALQVKLAQSDLPAGGTRNPQAHELVLKGLALINKSGGANFEAARQDFEQAIVLDPDYADAHAWLASVLLILTEHSNLALKATLPMARAQAQRALALDPRNTDAWMALGLADANADPPDIAKARTEYQKALALDPSSWAAHLVYGLVLPLKSALAQEQEAALLNPANPAAQGNLADDDQDLGDWAQDIRAFKVGVRLDPANVDNAFGLAYAHQQLHQVDKMVSAFDLVTPVTAVDKEQIYAGRLVYRAVQDSTLRPQALAALKYLSQHQSNPDVAGSLLQMYLALGQTAPALQLLESFCPAAPVSCGDLAINPIYRALRAGPRFQQLAKKYSTQTPE